MPNPTTHAHAFQAMNCQMAAWVCTDDEAGAQQALLEVQRWMEQVERELSRFRPDSDLCRLNAAAGQPYRAGELLWQATIAAMDAARATDGVFDPTIGRALIQAGYDRSFERLNQPSSPSASPSLLLDDANLGSGWQAVRLDPDQRTITLPPGVLLDLGGVAKGWAADRALDILRPLGPALVDAGGDLAVGDSPPGEPGWPIAIADPLSPEDDLVLLALSNAGLATSGTDHRRWRHRGQQQHHLIDPASGQPARTDILAAAVIAPTAAEADALALTLVVRGLDAADRWLLQHPHTPTLLALNDGRTYQNPAFARHARAYFPTYA